MAVTHMSSVQVGATDAQKLTHDRRDVTLHGTLLASGIANFQATLTVTGAKFRLLRWAQVVVFTGGGSAIAGRRTIQTGGSSVVATKRVTALSIIMLSGGFATAVTAGFAYEKRSARVAGTSFKVALRSHADGAATGVVSWMLVN